MMTYQIVHDIDDGWYATLDRDERLGPYLTEAECRRDVESIEKHIASGCFAGAR